MPKAIYLDMDGTIADLYGVPNWLEHLRTGSSYPYEVAAPMCDMEKLCEALQTASRRGFKIGVITWLSKDGDKEYNARVRKAKREWLTRYGLFDLMDSIQMVKYGTPKQYIAPVRRGILVDDNEHVRTRWEGHGGSTINPLKENIIDAILKESSRN